MSLFDRNKKKPENEKPADFSNVTGGHSSTARTIEPPQPAPTSPPSGGAAPQQSAPRTYTVVKGDSLSKIAKRVLGDMSKWPELYEMNKDVIGDDPNKIEPGQVLTLPA